MRYQKTTMTDDGDIISGGNDSSTKVRRKWLLPNYGSFGSFGDQPVFSVECYTSACNGSNGHNENILGWTASVTNLLDSVTCCRIYCYRPKAPQPCPKRKYCGFGRFVTRYPWPFLTSVTRRWLVGRDSLWRNTHGTNEPDNMTEGRSLKVTGQGE